MNEIKLDTRELDRILQNTKFTQQQIINRLAYQIQNRAARFAPVDTGALRNSIYVNTPGVSKLDIAQKHLAKRAGRKGRSRKSKRLFSSISALEYEPLPMPEKNHVIVGSPLAYAAHVEFGTSRMGAKPFLRPAVETIISQFNSGETWRELVK